ncbi:VOC family protein [Metabacillus malikii]|nr:VOC family protein [Metabacillus malikii]
MRITFQDDIKNSQVAFPDSDNFSDTCVRIGVGDLEKSVKWYKDFVGMELEAEKVNEDFVVMSLGVNHDPNGKSKWILERTSDHNGRTDGSIRPICFIQNRDDFFQYYHFLKESGIEVGEIGGFTEGGLSMFHFYDLDGNRFNVSSFV